MVGVRVGFRVRAGFGLGWCQGYMVTVELVVGVGLVCQWNWGCS